MFKIKTENLLTFILAFNFILMSLAGSSFVYGISVLYSIYISGSSFFSFMAIGAYVLILGSTILNHLLQTKVKKIEDDLRNEVDTLRERLLEIEKRVEK